MNVILAAFVLLSIFATALAKNESCGRVEDCPDAGTSCVNGICQCWTNQGPQIADIWSCNSDNTCARSFPGHVCRISRDCQRTQGRLGYCQPIGAIRAAAPQPQAQAPIVQQPARVEVAKAEVASTAPSISISTVATVASTTARVATAAPTTVASGAAKTTMRSIGGGYAGRRR